MIERCCRLAEQMASRIAEEPGAALVCPVELNQFMIRFGADQGDARGDLLTLATIQRLQGEAVAFMGPAQWRGRWVMRCSVASAETTEQSASESVAAVVRAWRAASAATT